MPECNPPVINVPEANLQNCLRWVFQNAEFNDLTVTAISDNARGSEGFNPNQDLNADERRENGNHILQAVQDVLNEAPYNIDGIINEQGQVEPNEELTYMCVCAALRREVVHEVIHWDLHFNRYYLNALDQPVLRGSSGNALRANTYDAGVETLTVNMDQLDDVVYANGVVVMLIPIPDNLQQGCQL